MKIKHIEEINNLCVYQTVDSIKVKILIIKSINDENF